jgi:hypothetical protein
MNLMPPVPPPPYEPPANDRPKSLQATAWFGLVAIIVVGVWFWSARQSPTVEFVSAHAAATYQPHASGFSLVMSGISKIGPVMGAGGYAVSATLAMTAVPVATASTSDGIWPPIVIAAPQPVWNLNAGGTALGVVRPLVARKDGSVLALTPAGLVSLTSAGSNVLIAGGSNDLIGALSPDASLAALKNPLTRAADLYSLTASSSSYLGSIPGNSLALAFSKSDLFVLSASSTVAVYSVSPVPGQAPKLVGTFTLPNQWP